MFRSLVLFIAAHYYFSGCNVFSYFYIFKFLNFEFLRHFFIGTYYLALSISRLLLFIFSLVISYFPYFKLILCNTLKKEGRAFRNIGKNISLYCVISLANFRLQPCPQVFSVNGSIICSGLHFWRHFDVIGLIIFGGLHFWRHWFNMAEILSKFGEQQLVMVNYACGFNQSETWKFFEWIIINSY